MICCFLALLSQQLHGQKWGVLGCWGQCPASHQCFSILDVTLASGPAQQLLHREGSVLVLLSSFQVSPFHATTSRCSKRSQRGGETFPHLILLGF